MTELELWGLVLIATGSFVCIYGNMLFRFSVAAIGFGVGMIAGFSLFKDQDDLTRVMVAFAIGGIAAIILFSVVNIAMYAAGAIFGVVLTMFIVSLLDVIGPNLNDNTFVVIILSIAGLAGGGLFGPRLGDWIVILATSFAGSFMILGGLQQFFGEQIPYNDNLSLALAQKIALFIFVIIAGISAISQHNYRDLRRAVLS